MRSDLPNENVVPIEELKPTDTTIVLINYINRLDPFMRPLRHHLNFSRWVVRIFLCRLVAIAENPVEAATLHLIVQYSTYERSGPHGQVLVSHGASWPLKYLEAIRVQAYKICQPAVFLVKKNLEHNHRICFSHFLQKVIELLLVPGFFVR